MRNFFIFIIIYLAIFSCDVIKIAEPSPTDNIQSEGAIGVPKLINFDGDTTNAIGANGTSYYQFSVDRNNYYIDRLNYVSGSSGYIGFQIYTDKNFTHTLDGSQIGIYSSSLDDVKLYKNTTYYLAIYNSNVSGVTIKLQIEEKTQYPSITNLTFGNLINQSVGDFGVQGGKKYFSFTTTSGGYYIVTRTYPVNKQVFEVLFSFRPDGDPINSGQFTNNQSKYSLIGNTTYYITIHSDYSEPIPFTVQVDPF